MFCSSANFCTEEHLKFCPTVLHWHFISQYTLQIHSNSFDHAKQDPTLKFYGISLPIAWLSMTTTPLLPILSSRQSKDWNLIEYLIRLFIELSSENGGLERSWSIHDVLNIWKAFYNLPCLKRLWCIFLPFFFSFLILKSTSILYNPPFAIN